MRTSTTFGASFKSNPGGGDLTATTTAPAAATSRKSTAAAASATATGSRRCGGRGDLRAKGFTQVAAECLQAKVSGSAVIPHKSATHGSVGFLCTYSLAELVRPRALQPPRPSIRQWAFRAFRVPRRLVGIAMFHVRQILLRREDEVHSYSLVVFLTAQAFFCKVRQE